MGEMGLVWTPGNNQPEAWKRAHVVQIMVLSNTKDSIIEKFHNHTFQVPQFEGIPFCQCQRFRLHIAFEMGTNYGCWVSQRWSAHCRTTASDVDHLINNGCGNFLLWLVEWSHPFWWSLLCCGVLWKRPVTDQRVCVARRLGLQELDVFVWHQTQNALL